MEQKGHVEKGIWEGSAAVIDPSSLHVYHPFSVGSWGGRGSFHRKQINHSLHAVYLSPHLAQQDNLLPAHQDSPLHSHHNRKDPKLEKHLHRKMTCPKKLMMMHTSQKSDQSRTDQQTKYKLPIVRTEPFYKWSGPITFFFFTFAIYFIAFYSILYRTNRNSRERVPRWR